MADLRDISKLNFTSSQGNTLEAISAGSLQRIADATEKMAQRHTDLMRERDMYEGYYRSECNSHNMTRLKLRAARGVITKLHKQLAEAQRAASLGSNIKPELDDADR